MALGVLETRGLSTDRRQRHLLGSVGSDQAPNQACGHECFETGRERARFRGGRATASRGIAEVSAGLVDSDG